LSIIKHIKQVHFVISSLICFLEEGMFANYWGRVRFRFHLWS